MEIFHRSLFLCLLLFLEQLNELIIVALELLIFVHHLENGKRGYALNIET